MTGEREGPDPPKIYLSAWDAPLVFTPLRVADAIAGTIPLATCKWAAEDAPPHPSDHLGTAAWWARRADEATTAMLKVDRQQLSGVVITSQTARCLRLRPSKFQKLSNISPDGSYFPADPAAFRREVYRQAQVLYGGHPALRMDANRLRASAAAAPHLAVVDSPPFRTLMLRARAGLIPITDPPPPRHRSPPTH